MECGSITEAEQAEIDGIVFEEDICDVSDKIKRGIYEGEGGEYDYEEDIRSIVIPYEGEEEDKSTLAEEEQEIKKVTDLVEKVIVIRALTQILALGLITHSFQESIATVAVLEEEEPEKSKHKNLKLYCRISVVLRSSGLLFILCLQVNQRMLRNLKNKM